MHDTILDGSVSDRSAVDSFTARSWIIIIVSSFAVSLFKRDKERAAGLVLLSYSNARGLSKWVKRFNSCATAAAADAERKIAGLYDARVGVFRSRPGYTIDNLEYKFFIYINIF